MPRRTCRSACCTAPGDTRHIEAVKPELKNSQRLEGEIWSRALAAAQGSQPATMLLVPALNRMFDIVTTRTMAVQMHPPPTVFAMLFVLALIASVVAGYHTARSDTGDWLRIAGFAAVTSLVFFVIHDMEFPRFGLIRLGAFDRVLADLREAMK